MRRGDGEYIYCVLVRVNSQIWLEALFLRSAVMGGATSGTLDEHGKKFADPG
jgi:hypothetical protein